MPLASSSPVTPKRLASKQQVPKPPPSPFFHPKTPVEPHSVVVVQQSPGGTRRQRFSSRNNNQTNETAKSQSHDSSSPGAEHKSGLIGCTSNLINAIVGSGIVGVPYAIRQAGFHAGIALIVLCAVITTKSLRLLIGTAKHVHVPSYEMVAEAAFGMAGFRFITINMFITAYGAMLSYLMIVKDCFSTLAGVDPDNVAVQRSILVLISAIIMVPISSRRDMADLAGTSRLNVLIDTVLIILVAYNAPIRASVDMAGGWEEILLNTSEMIHVQTIFVALGVLSFAFVCQHSAFIIAGSLERPTVKRWDVVTGSALTVCASLALACGSAGYLGFLDNTQGNILSNLNPRSLTANIARAMLGTTMLFVYPLESFVSRHVLVVLLFSGRRAHEGDDSSVLTRRDRRIGLTVALYLAAVIPAALFRDLGFVLAITGAVGGSSLSYIGPGAVYLGIHGQRFLELVRASWLGEVLVEREQQQQRQQQQEENNKDNQLKHEHEHDTETTPMVPRKQQQQRGKDEEQRHDSKQEQPESRSIWDTVQSTLSLWMKRVVWHATLMPCWCAIARRGDRGLTKHAHDMALKSPHPIRIGDVEYKRVQVKHSNNQQQHRSNDATTSNVTTATCLSPGGGGGNGVSFISPMHMVVRQNSLPLGNAAGAIMPPPIPVSFDDTILDVAAAGGAMGTIDQQIGQQILDREMQSQQKQKKTKQQRRQRQRDRQNGDDDDDALEPDPQQDPPTWTDFYIAIFFVLFGIAALCAGLLSLNAG